MIKSENKLSRSKITEVLRGQQVQQVCGFSSQILVDL